MEVDINQKAPVISRSGIKISAPIERVWAILTTIDRWPEWQRDVVSVKIDTGVAEGAKFTWKAGGITFYSQLHTVQPHQAFGWTGKVMGAYAIHNWILSSRGDTTIVYVEESLQGFLPTTFKTFFQKTLNKGIEKSLLELKEASESHK